MNFYFSLKVMKEKEQKVDFQKQQLLHQQTMEIKQLKLITTPKCSYSSSQTEEFHPLLRASRDHSTLQT